MRTKFQSIVLSLAILLCGLSAPFLPNILYPYHSGQMSDKLSNLSPETMSNKFTDTLPFVILSLFSLLLLYRPKSPSLRLRRICGIVVAFVLLFIGTFDANRPWNYSHYDVGPGLGFIDVLFIPVLYVFGYFLGWIGEVIYGIKEQSVKNDSAKR